MTMAGAIAVRFFTMFFAPAVPGATSSRNAAEQAVHAIGGSPISVRLSGTGLAGLPCSSVRTGIRPNKDLEHRFKILSFRFSLWKVTIYCVFMFKTVC